MSIVEICHEYGKTVFSLPLDGICKFYAVFFGRTGEQVLTGDEEVLEFAASEVAFKILQEQAEGAIEIRRSPFAVFGSVAAGT